MSITPIHHHQYLQKSSLASRKEKTQKAKKEAQKRKISEDLISQRECEVAKILVELAKKSFSAQH